MLRATSTAVLAVALSAPAASQCNLTNCHEQHGCGFTSLTGVWDGCKVTVTAYLYAYNSCGGSTTYPLEIRAFRDGPSNGTQGCGSTCIGVANYGCDEHSGQYGALIERVHTFSVPQSWIGSTLWLEGWKRTGPGPGPYKRQFCGETVHLSPPAPSQVVVLPGGSGGAIGISHSPTLGQGGEVTLAGAPCGSFAGLAVGSHVCTPEVAGLFPCGCGDPLWICDASGFWPILSGLELVPTQCPTGAGEASTPFSIPKDPSLVGQGVYAQWIVAEPRPAPVYWELSTSDVLAAVVGSCGG